MCPKTWNFTDYSFEYGAWSSRSRDVGEGRLDMIQSPSFEQAEREVLSSVAAAIDGCPQFWFRENDGPWEVCRYGSFAEPEIVVVGQFADYGEAKEAHTKIISEARAAAAIKATREATSWENRSAADGLVSAVEDNSRLRSILRALLEADERGQGLPWCEAMERARRALDGQFRSLPD